MSSDLGRRALSSTTSEHHQYFFISMCPKGAVAPKAFGLSLLTLPANFKGVSQAWPTPHQRPVREEHTASSERLPAPCTPASLDEEAPGPRAAAESAAGRRAKGSTQALSPGCPLLRRLPAYSTFPAGLPNSHPHNSSISRVWREPLLGPVTFPGGSPLVTGPQPSPRFPRPHPHMCGAA